MPRAVNAAWRSKMHAVLKLSFCAALGIASAAQAQTLRLEEAQRRAVDRSRQLVAQDSAVRSSRELAVAAGQLPDPVLKAGIDNLPVNGPDQFSTTRDFMTMRRIGVMQELTRGEKRDLRAQRFEREAEKGIAEKAMATASIERGTALAWLERYYAEAILKVGAEQMEQVKGEIAAAEAVYRGGRGSQADVIGAHSTLAAPPAMEAVRLDEATLDQDLLHHPEIAVLAKQEEIAVAEAKIAQASSTPDWTVEVAYQQRGPLFSNMVSVGVSVPLPWDRANRQDREVASKLAMADQARAQREEMLRAHAGELRGMLAEWRNGRERLLRYKNDLLPLAAERSKAALAGYQGGKTGITDLLLARRNETDMQMQAVQLEMDTARVWAQLNFLIPSDAGHTG